jgi:hypothetical protein
MENTKTNVIELLTPYVCLFNTFYYKYSQWSALDCDSSTVHCKLEGRRQATLLPEFDAYVRVAES